MGFLPKFLIIVTTNVDDKKIACKIIDAGVCDFIFMEEVIIVH